MKLEQRKNKYSTKGVWATVLSMVMVCNFLISCTGCNRTDDTSERPVAESNTSQVEETDLTSQEEETESEVVIVPATESVNADTSTIPAYSDTAYAVVNDNQPYFTEEELAQAVNSYEYYSPWIVWGVARLPLQVSVRILCLQKRWEKSVR